MAHPFLHDSFRWRRSAERARASADKLRGFPDLQEVMIRIAGVYENLASKADREEADAQQTSASPSLTFPWRA